MSQDLDVTCICMTHGRSWLVAEVVESWRRQQFGNLRAELLILNDCQQVSFTCGWAGVRVVNWPEWVPDLSAKTNLALTLARGRVFCLTDDDDIFLPRFLADGVANMGAALAYRPGLCWTLGPGGLRDNCGEPLLVGAFLDRTFAMDHGGAKPGEWNDRSLWDIYWPTGNVVQRMPTPSEMNAIYRWNGHEWHASGQGGAWSQSKAAEFAKRVRTDARFVAGRVEIKPAWRSDYLGMVRIALAQGKGKRRQA